MKNVCFFFFGYVPQGAYILRKHASVWKVPEESSGSGEGSQGSGKRVGARRQEGREGTLLRIHVGFYDEIHPLLGARRCEQESCAHQKHAVRHGRDRAAGGHRGGAIGPGVIQQQSTTFACAKFESHRLRGTPSIYMKQSERIVRIFFVAKRRMYVCEIITKYQNIQNAAFECSSRM